MTGLDQVRHKNPVHQEPWTVLNHDGQFAKLLHKAHGATNNLGIRATADDYFDQLRTMHRIDVADGNDHLTSLPVHLPRR